MRRVFDDDEEEDDDDNVDEPLSIDEDGPADDADGEVEGFGTMPCPYCGGEMSDLAEVCPHCKSFVSREDVPRERRPTWVVVVTVLLLIALTIGAVSFR